MTAYAETPSFVRRRHALLALLILLSGCSLRPPPTPPTSPSAPPLARSAATPAKPSTGGDAELKARFAQALALMKQRQYAAAQAAFARLAAEHPEAAGAFTNLGILYADQHQWDLALQAFGQALHADATDPVTYNWMGICYRHKRDYLRAEQAYRQALKIEPGDADVHFNLALLYDRYLHRPRQALAEYRAYLAADRGRGHDDGRELIVRAWIRQIEATLPGAKPTTPASAPESAAASVEVPR